MIVTRNGMTLGIDHPLSSHNLICMSAGGMILLNKYCATWRQSRAGLARTHCAYLAIVHCIIRDGYICIVYKRCR